MSQTTQSNGASANRTASKTRKGTRSYTPDTSRQGRQTRYGSQSASQAASYQSSDSDENEAAACKLCQKNLTEASHAIKCEHCTKWICQSCANLDNDEYRFLTNRPQFHWYCTPCESDAIQAVQNDALIEERCQEFLSKYEKRLDDIEEKMDTKADKSTVDSLNTTVQVLNDQVKYLATDISRLNQKIESVRFEPAEKAKRKNNIVIRGYPESENLTDTERVKEILDKIGCGTITPTEITRLGRRHTNRNQWPPSDRTHSQGESAAEDILTPNTPDEEQAGANGVQTLPSRPIRCTLASVDIKSKVLRAAKNIRQTTSLNYNQTRIFIVPDQTYLERQDDLELRKKLKAKRDASP